MLMWAFMVRWPEPVWQRLSQMILTEEVEKGEFDEHDALSALWRALY